MQSYYTAAYRKQAVEFDTVSEATGRALHINCIPMEEEGCCACLLNPRREQQYRERLESENAAMRNVHLALVSGAWKLQYNEKGELIHCGWSNTMRKMLGFESQEDFPNTFEAWAKLLHPEERDYTLKEYYDTVMDYTDTKNLRCRAPSAQQGRQLPLVPCRRPSLPQSRRFADFVQRRVHQCG